MEVPLPGLEESAADRVEPETTADLHRSHGRYSEASLASGRWSRLHG